MNRAKLAAMTILAVSVLTVSAASTALLYQSGRISQHAEGSWLLPALRMVSPEMAHLSTARSYIGVFERGVPYTYAPVREFTHKAGLRPDLLVYYSGWGDPFQVRFAGEARQHGATVMVQMMPGTHSMTSIIAGRSDAYLSAYARAVRAFGGQVVISFAPEANGFWYPWGYRHTRPQVWIAAWRHVVALFRREGAVNVTWLWDMSRKTHITYSLRAYWPGSRYVTWAGLDAYIYTRHDSFGTILAPTVAEIRKFTNAPVLISETAVGTFPGRAARIKGLFAGVLRDHLLGLVWFDAAQHGGLYHQDWRLEDNPAALAAFRDSARLLQH